MKILDQPFLGLADCLRGGRTTSPYLPLDNGEPCLNLSGAIDPKTLRGKKREGMTWSSLLTNPKIFTADGK